MILKSPPHKLSRQFENESFLYLHRSFQSRYVGLLTLSLFLSASVFLLTAFYFTQENYQIFKTLAFETQPELVRHIERESNWLLFLLGVSLFSCGFCAYRISQRMTSHLINPLIDMEKHMRTLLVGDWKTTDYRFSESSDFKDLAMTYDYLLSMLRSLTEQEIEQLSRMRLDPHEKETLHIWSHMIDQKRKRLGLSPISETFLKTAAKTDQRRAS